MSFNPSSLESYLESQPLVFSGDSQFSFQSFFSGKLFGKCPFLPSALGPVICFNPSSLESYLESRVRFGSL